MRPKKRENKGKNREGGNETAFCCVVLLSVDAFMSVIIRFRRLIVRSVRSAAN